LLLMIKLRKGRKDIEGREKVEDGRRRGGGARVRGVR
jgi:hypothetical protein